MKFLILLIFFILSCLAAKATIGKKDSNDDEYERKVIDETRELVLKLLEQNPSGTSSGSKSLSEVEALVKQIVPGDFPSQKRSTHNHFLHVQLISQPTQETLDMIKNLKGERVQMMSDDKLPYECILPDLSDSKTEENQPPTSISIPELLAPLAKQCVYRWAGWWVYEWCPGRHLRQYHQDLETGKNNMPVAGTMTQNYLGFRGEGRHMAEMAQHMDDRQWIHHHEQKQLDLPGKEMDLYYQEIYSDGSLCDITGNPRETEVRFYCDLRGPTSISDVKEDSTCSYIMTIQTPLLCQHPKYSPKNPETETIVCYSLFEKPGAPNSIEFLLKEEENTIHHIEVNEEDFDDFLKGNLEEILKENLEEILKENLEENDLEENQINDEL